MSAFNLTREPWIPVETLDGIATELSTRDTLARAHTLRGLADPSPLVMAALTRHLLAVLHRAYSGPRSMEEWCGIVSSGAFDPSRVDAYLDSVENRMDLFHPTHPFAQTRGLRERFADYVVPIDELEVQRARWGGGRELFRHRPPSPAPQMAPGRAALALLAHHAFATGGLVRKPGEPTAATAAPLTRAGVVILRGATLFRTLISNLLEYDPENGVPIPTGGAADACSWEQASPPRELPQSSEPRRRPYGYLDLLTWVSRRVELVGENGLVTGFINNVGQGLADDAPCDPMVTYRRHEKLGLLPVGIDVERSFWRAADALFETARGSNVPFERPRAIDMVSSVKAHDVLGGDTMFDVEVLGLAAEKSRIDAVRVERVQTLARCFNDPDARTAVHGSLDRCREGVDALRTALFTYARAALAPAGRDPDTGDVRALVDSFNAVPAAWSALGLAFEEFLRGLGDPERATNAFDFRARDIIKDAFRSATARPDTTARWLKARALAERSLRQKLPQRQPSEMAAQTPES